MDWGSVYSVHPDIVGIYFLKLYSNKYLESLIFFNDDSKKHTFLFLPGRYVCHTNKKYKCLLYWRFQGRAFVNL